MNSSELYSSIKGAFENAGWSYSEVDGREVITCGFEAQHTRVSLHVQAFPEVQVVSVVSQSTLSTDQPEKRDRLAELAMRVNTGLTCGAFEMNWHPSAQLIFRQSNVFPTPQGDLSIIAGMVNNVVVEMDRISPIEVLIHQAEGPDLVGIDIAKMLQRDDLLPGAEA